MNKKFYLAIIFIFLIISVSTSAKEFKGAEYRTKQSFLYGRFEVSMKSAYREGMLSSFFTYYDGGGGISTWNEIDIEILGRYPNDIQFNTITPGQVNHVSHYPMSSSPHTDYHTYAFEWTPNYVAWFVDGVEVYKQTGPHIQTLNRAQKIMMNIWNPQAPNWAGAWNPNVLPAFAFYDWVSYYSYTPGTGNYGTGNNFTHSWTDNFDYWNTSRWDKASHTWDGNGCDFIYENVVFQNGKLILCLTDSINIGYTDIKGPVYLSARTLNEKVLVYFTEELDQSSAENISNYFIPGVTITNAQLRSDRKTVQLSVDGWDFVSPKTLLVLNVKDTFLNTMSARNLTIILTTQFSFPLKINCAGPAALGYLPDQEFTLNSDYGFMDGSSSSYSNTLQINNTDEDEIYRSEKYGMVTYNVRLHNGIYNVKLMFAENYFTQAGKRIFDVYVEGSRVLQDFDIFNLVGNNTAYVKEVNTVSVNDGELNIHFAAKIDNPMINGIVIELVSLGINDEYIPKEHSFILNQNYPNPFNGQTQIEFIVNQPDYYKFSVYDVRGSQIAIIDLGYLENGYYKNTFDVKKIQMTFYHPESISMY
ncbi:Beta-glucanase/beta-glucan synthetase [Ignavibacterium album JCM 16511]|uniref:Beta-glucanase/beta-glucan synthetase n=1 Tax=Ignavibacterium album (strain DSM 19864 / JCM 16511 / NBRC 101810 / Mat9-16) TaxID=945713 RepID=I0AMS6_IGNAJ|nr:malectin domain-containing carbohydrate-binding protein [Ignavibacterium album]AFH50283.1 Beta-glucanase/beta-glucan synthetase [Ignavibacterium album JCM 16511]